MALAAVCQVLMFQVYGCEAAPALTVFLGGDAAHGKHCNDLLKSLQSTASSNLPHPPGHPIQMVRYVVTPLRALTRPPALTCEPEQAVEWWSSSNTHRARAVAAFPHLLTEGGVVCINLAMYES